MFALDLAGVLARGGRWEVALVSLFGVDASYGTAASGAGVPVTVMQPDGQARGYSPRLVRQLQALIEAGQFQIVQANGAATLKYLAVARRLARRPWGLVYRAIGIGSHWRRGWGRRVVYRWLLDQADRVVAVSRAVADDLGRDGRAGSGRVVVIPNGVEPKRVQSDPAERSRIREELDAGPEDTLLVYAGSLAPEKNLHAIIEVVARCRASGLPVRALLIGDGRCREGLAEDVRRRALEPDVRFLPPQERIGRFLAAADLCVLPSTSEGMPALLIEAGLAGVPAVAYAVGGIPEVIDHDVTGLLVRPNDQDGLTAAVRALVSERPRRLAMGAAAAARYRRFEIGEIARAYDEMYRTLLLKQEQRSA